jgi:protease I
MQSANAIDACNHQPQGGCAWQKSPSPDHLRSEEAVVSFVREFGRSGKPIAAVCHGPQLLIEADLVRGKMVTSWPSVRTDLKNEAAWWVDKEVVQDGALISSRKLDDLPAFSEAFLKRLG